MCLGMNPDQLSPKERCASTSNRNFEGRQGALGRTHLVSPAMAAAAAVTGKLTDVRTLDTPFGDTLTTSWEQFVGSDPVPEAPAFATAHLDRQATSGGGSAASEASGMPRFTTLTGIAAPFPLQNVDTDMIIPKQFLKTIKRTGLGKSAFFSLRYNEDGSEKSDFVLNKDAYRSAKILVCGDNFGCGSSREHAPWAINDFGIRCLIATSFADIFCNNCFKNGMLPIKLPAADVAQLAADAEALKQFEIDLPAQKIKRADGSTIAFEVEAFKKHCLVNGLDDVGLTMQKGCLIEAFEAKRSAQFPWLDGPGFKGKTGSMKLAPLQQGKKDKSQNVPDW